MDAEDAEYRAIQEKRQPTPEEAAEWQRTHLRSLGITVELYQMADELKTAGL